ELGLERGELSVGRAAQQMANEGGVPCKLGEDARIQAMLRVRARKEVLNKKLTRGSVSFEVLQQDVELFARDGFVIVPPDTLLRRRVADSELVLRGTSRMGAGLHNKRTRCSKARLAAANGCLDQLHERPIVADG